jgi:hypothetical protein
MTFDDVRKIALALDRVEESTSYGWRNPGGRHMDFDQRAELLAAVA